MITRNAIAKLQRLEEGATASPWTANPDPVDAAQDPSRQHGTWDIHEMLEDDPPILVTRHIDQAVNAKLVVEARNALPDLLLLADRWLRLEALLEKRKAAPEQGQHWNLDDVIKVILAEDPKRADG